VVDAEVALGRFVEEAAVTRGEKMAVVCAMTTNALTPLCSRMLIRPVNPSSLEWSHEIGNTMGVSNSTPKSYALSVRLMK